MENSVIITVPSKAINYLSLVIEKLGITLPVRNKQLAEIIERAVITGHRLGVPVSECVIRIKDDLAFLVSTKQERINEK